MLSTGVGGTGKLSLKISFKKKFLKKERKHWPVPHLHEIMGFGC